jgi:hypothetical protein
MSAQKDLNASSGDATPERTASPDADSSDSQLLFCRKDISHYVQVGIEAALEKINTDFAALHAKIDSVVSENLALKEQLKCMQQNAEMEKAKAEERFNRLEARAEAEGAGGARNIVPDEYIQSTEKQINDLEQYSRRSHLRIRGLRMQHGESYKGAVARLCNSRLGIRITETDLDDAHPLPVKMPKTQTQQIQHNGPPPPPTMIARFHRRDQRDAILRARTALKGQGIVISEDLTSKNQGLLKKLHDSESIKSSWSWMGKIYAIVYGETKVIRFDIHDTIPGC